MKETWYIPCNISFCDVIGIIEKNGEVAWRRGALIHKDDIAYIYVGSPIGEMKYKCTVIDEDLSPEIMESHQYARRIDDKSNQKYMMLKAIHKFSEGELPLVTLKKHGLTQVQRQARISVELQDYLNGIISGISETESVEKDH